MVPWDPSEGTLFRVTVDWPDFWIYTFELVIHLSKVKQLALPFCTISAMSRWSFGPRVPRQNACLSEWSRSEQPETPFFDHCSSSLWHSWHQARQVHACRFGDSFFWWFVWWGQTYCAPNSMELESRLCHCGTTWPRSRQGNNARPLSI